MYENLVIGFAFFYIYAHEENSNFKAMWMGMGLVYFFLAVINLTSVAIMLLTFGFVVLITLKELWTAMHHEAKAAMMSG